MTDASLRATAALLGEVFPGADRVADEAYLRWLYEASPFGPVVAAERTDDAGLSAHYAVVPIDLGLDGATTPGALSLNTAVSERARGGGVFVTLAGEAYDLARERGIRVVTGVANANSTPGFQRRLGFAVQGQLPVQVIVPTPGSTRGVRRGDAHAPIADTLLQGTERLLAATGPGLTRHWTPETLRWRLASPGARYALHRSEHALVVSTAESRSGVRVGIVLAIFVDPDLADLGARELRLLTRSVCVHHRAPLALHAGFNDRIAVRGLTLPDRLRPSPLNLITRALAGTVVPRPSRWEFLDFDAY